MPLAVFRCFLMTRRNRVLQDLRNCLAVDPKMLCCRSSTHSIHVACPADSPIQCTVYISPPSANEHQVPDCGILLRDDQII